MEKLNSTAEFWEHSPPSEVPSTQQSANIQCTGRLIEMSGVGNLIKPFTVHRLTDAGVI